MNREPFVKLRPVFKDYLWGGDKLKKLYGASETRVAEAWLLSVHPDGPSMIAGGRYQDMLFADYLKKEGFGGAFPILIKLIDSAQNLSVQVHPGDAYARAHENDRGKSEMWTVLESEPDAFLYMGFSRDVTKAEIRRRVEDGTIEEILNRVLTRAGDTFFIPAGTVHAIGAGNLILEAQQSSNATYRLYDYNRRDARGSLRPLHLDKALDVLVRQKYSAGAPFDFLDAERRAVNGSLTLPMADGRFASVVCVGGEGGLRRDGRQTALSRGDSLYLPAGPNPAEIEGGLQIVVTRAAPLSP